MEIGDLQLHMWNLLMLFANLWKLTVKALFIVNICKGRGGVHNSHYANRRGV